MQVQLRDLIINCIVELLRLESKEPSFPYHYNLVLQNEIFFMAYQLIRQDLNKRILAYLLESYCRGCSTPLANRNSIFVRSDSSKGCPGVVIISSHCSLNASS